METYSMTLTEFILSGLSGVLVAVIIIQYEKIQELKSYTRTLKSSKRWNNLYNKRIKENRQ